MIVYIFIRSYRNDPVEIKNPVFVVKKLVKKK